MAPALHLTMDRTLPPLRLNSIPQSEWSAITYGRRSFVRGTVDMVGVEKQVAYGNEKAIQKGVSPDRIFVFRDDKGHRSARWQHTRPGWMESKVLMAANPTIVFLIVHKFERASRGVKDSAEIIETCESLGVAVISIYDQIDMSVRWNSDERERLYYTSVRSQGESDRASERQKENVKFRKANNIYWGASPFGSTRVGKGLRARMVKHVQTLMPGGSLVNGAAQADGARVIHHAATVERLIELWASGLSFERTASQLNAEGYKHLRVERDEDGGTIYRLVDFEKGSIQSIAWNVLFYTGHLVKERRWKSKHSKVELDGQGNLLEQMARAYGAERVDTIEPIIGDELACRAIASRINRRRTGRSLSEPRALLTPLLKTSDGRVMRANFCNGRFVYRTRVGASVYLDVKPLDDTLRRHLSNVAIPDELREEMLSIHRADNKDNAKAKLRARITQLNIDLRKVGELYRAGVYSEQDTMKEAAKVRAAIADANARLNVPDEMEGVIASMNMLGERFANMPIYNQKRIIQMLFTDIRISEEGEIARLTPTPEAHQFFGLVLSAIERVQTYPRQDLNGLQDIQKSASWIRSMAAANVDNE